MRGSERRNRNGDLAGPGTRLAAVLINVALAAPLAWIAQESGCANTLDSIGLSALVGFAILQNVQVYLLATSGQSIGKRVMKIRIVDVHTGGHSGWFRVVIVRGLVNRILLAVTLGLYGLVDALFIFRADRRTIHDMMARTRVDRIAP